MQSHWDGPQYSIAIRQFDLLQETPASPGYPLYIFFGWVVDKLVGDPHGSLIVVSVLFSCLAAGLFYLFGKRIWNKSVGIVASMLFITGPTFYFFSLTAYPYGLLSSFILLLSLVVYEISFRKKHFGLLLGTISGLFFGFRPQELPMILPLMVFGFVFLTSRERFLSIVSFVLVSLLWIIPTSFLAGGIREYISISQRFVQSAVSPFSVEKVISHFGRIGKGLYLSFTIGIVFLTYYPIVFIRKRQSVNKNIKLILFFSFWAVPSLLFNMFIRTDHAGYQMTYLSALLLFVSYAIWRLFQTSKILFFTIVCGIVIFNLFWFFRDRDPQLEKPYIPTSFHYSEIVKKR